MTVEAEMLFCFLPNETIVIDMTSITQNANWRLKDKWLISSQNLKSRHVISL
ncbi:hypothetical protein ZOSMA_101G00060 [Zostera marina]|uniref:Uncharacterized protein n=1 Tax=Zostera marina TaxID=29655 RepID=A0A0K9Q563_ZOSMR|nr:hypothetical protein ZOSMA_101G00060 [Zostera marina]